MHLQPVFGAALWAFAQTASCRAVRSTAIEDLVEHETAQVLPAGWAYHSPAESNETLHLRIALAHPEHADHHLQLAASVSDPSSANYGAYLSAAELQAVLPDVSAAANAVTAWLESTSDVQHISQDGEWISFTTTVSSARTLLGASFAHYSYNNEAPVLRTQSYSIPAHLQRDIAFLFPTTQFLRAGGSRRRSNSSPLEARQHSLPSPPDCTVDVCPANLVTRYNIDYFPPDASSGSSIAIAGFLEEHANRTDLQAFLHTYGLNNFTADYEDVLVNGGLAPAVPERAGAEAMLDLEYTLAFTGPLRASYISTGGRPPQVAQPGNVSVPAADAGNEPYLEFLDYLLGLEEPPHVISISYSDDEQTVPEAYARRACDLFGRLALRGVSVIDASGDGGAVGTGSGECVGAGGEKKFIPTFPATCPWVTAVGATAAYGGPATWSAGGFSDYFARPAWQEGVVGNYVRALNGSHAGFYDGAGRAFPDVSLIGTRFVTTVGGWSSSQKGTSASTPVFAAMVALLNDLRLRAGKPVLGFLNPLLYSEGLKGVYKDVVEGQGGGCSSSTWFEPGWEALPGWDAVTGLGEPDFKKLREAVVG